ncbi:MAG: hypothetical protein WAN60_13065 [Candidatus Sulfotelmatobacter sp.]
MLAIANGPRIVWYILAFLAGLFAIFAFGSLLWQIWDFSVKRKRSGQSPEQFLQAKEQLGAEQMSKAVNEWRLPPELNLPAPRPVTSGRLGTRLRRSIPFLLLLMFLGLITWQTTWRLWPSAVLGSLFLLIGYFTHKKEQNLLKWGKPARAVVTSFSMGGAGGGGAWQLEYHDAAGNLIKGSVSRGSPPKNPVLTVLYDPDKPHRFTPYPVARYQIVAPESS